MLLSIIIIYALTLLYLSVVERFRHYAMLVGIQGWLLMGIALLQLHPGEEWGTLLFVVIETVVCKGIIVPYMLFRIIRSTQINRVGKKAIPSFASVILSTVALVVSLSISYWVSDTQANSLFFGVSMFGLIAGLLLITTHQRIFSHLVGFLIIENAVFLFSLVLGVEMPILVNVGILLDILMGILLLGLFISKIGYRLPEMDAEKFSSLKD